MSGERIKMKNKLNCFLEINKVEKIAVRYTGRQDKVLINTDITSNNIDEVINLLQDISKLIKIAEGKNEI